MNISDVDLHSADCILNDRFVSIAKVTSKLVYKHFANKNYVIPVCQYTLMNVYHFDEQSCQNLFTMPRKATIDNRLRWLQFRINHFIIPTNKWLYKIKKVTSPYCARCKTNIESINHLFIYCINVNNFWLEFLVSWNFLYSNITPKEKLFGIDNDADNWKLKNQLLMIARRFIYICRCRGSTLSMIAFNNVVRDTTRLEEIIARQRGEAGSSL